MGLKGVVKRLMWHGSAVIAPRPPQVQLFLVHQLVYFSSGAMAIFLTVAVYFMLTSLCMLAIHLCDFLLLEGHFCGHLLLGVWAHMLPSEL